LLSLGNFTSSLSSFSCLIRRVPWPGARFRPLPASSLSSAAARHCPPSPGRVRTSMIVHQKTSGPDQVKVVQSKV
jgi:hypothetical protein